LNSHRARVTLFRILLTAAVLGILFLATTPLACPIASDINDKLSHVVAFFVLAGLTDFSFPEAKNRLALALALLGYGLTIEIIQHFLPWRMFSLMDVAADALGIGCGQMALLFLKKKGDDVLTKK
jgi:VanZ family protein